MTGLFPVSDTQPKEENEPSASWDYATVHEATSPQVYPAETSEELAVGSTKGEEDDPVIHMYFALTNVNPDREQLFSRYANSLLRHTQSHLHIHAIVDEGGRATVSKAIPNGKRESGAVITVEFYDVYETAKQVELIVDTLRHHFSSGKRSYYHNPIFFLPIALHTVLPESIKKIIVLDTDMEFRADIKFLYANFDKFAPSNIMGLAFDQQPVYRHILHMYRAQHPGTLIGAPPPDGLAGFNSGCVLMDLEKMRQSELYSEALKGEMVKRLADKFQFQGHLGDQDFYSLLSMEHPEMFYILPCTWNRQLCRWWEGHGYRNVFEEYHRCEGTVQLYHGNCNTPIPQDDKLL